VFVTVAGDGTPPPSIHPDKTERIFGRLSFQTSKDFFFLYLLSGANDFSVFNHPTNRPDKHFAFWLIGIGVIFPLHIEGRQDK
jgi:hypothetical protein